MAQEYNRLEGYNLDKGSLSNVGISEDDNNDLSVKYKRIRKLIDGEMKDLKIAIKKLDDMQKKDQNSKKIISISKGLYERLRDASMLNY